MRKSKQKHTLAMALSAVMILNTMPIFADEVNIEVSEYIHDADCNHIEGQPCIHEHTEDCHTLNCIDETEEHSHSDECFELNCTHLHNADCEYVEARECSCKNQDEGDNQINCTLTEGCNQLSEHEGECETLDKQQGIKVNNWVFNDADNLNEGVLVLPGVNSTNQIDLETLVNMLPKSISMLEGDRSELDIISWNCPEFVIDEDGNWPSSSEYIFTAELPEGYDFELTPSIKVLLGGTELYDISRSNEGQAGDFTVIGDALDYEWNNPVLTIKSGATLTIQNTNPNEPTKHRIVVEQGAKDVNITLNGVNIDLNNLDDCAFDMTDAEVNLILTKDSVNTLISGINRAGLEVQEGAKLTIKGSGTLTAKNNLNGAGIGGKGTDEKGFNGGNITIMENVVVNAEGSGGAGIGGGRGSNGNGGNGGTITIQDNAQVTANSSTGAGIGGGMSNADANAKGGDGGTVIIQGNAQVTAKSSAGAGIGGGRGNNVNGGNGGTVTIKDSAQVTATSTEGAGIGGGMSNADANAKGGDGGTVIIQGNAQVTATSTEGAGIGGGKGNGVDGGNGGMVKISGEGIKVIADGMAAIGSSRPFPNKPNGGKLSVSEGATLELKTGNADAVSEFKNCTIIYSNGAEIQYDDQSKVITNLSLNATINDNDSGNVTVTVTATLTGAVDGNAGKTIRFSGNIEVSENTNANGFVSFTISNLNPGNYTFTATYDGDEKNNSAIASVTIKVIAAPNGTSSSISSPKNTYQSTSDTINQTISSYNLKSLIRNKKNLTLNSNQVSMTFEPAALKAILDVIPSSARRIMFTAVPKVKVNQDGLKIDPLYDFSISYKDTKGKNIVVDVDFPKGSASIALKYESNEKPESLFIVTVDKKGNVTWLDQSSYKDGRVMAEVEHYSIYGVAYKASEMAYVDIKDHWAESDIKYVLIRNLLTGTSAQTFSPDAVMTQGMLAAALERLNGVEPKAYIKDYKADAYLTREEMAVIMLDYMKESGYTIPSTLKAVKYADQRLISTKARSSVKAMQQAGIIKGKAGNLYDPQGSVTKGEGAAMLRRLIEVMIEPTTANGWHKNDSGQWKFYEKGKAVTGWQTINKLRYYFDDDGEMYEGWKYDKKKWYYWNNDGAVIGWKFINGKWYYFESDGVMASNTWIEGYKLGVDGAMKTNN